jgi:hypothetical protein
MPININQEIFRPDSRHFNIFDERIFFSRFASLARKFHFFLILFCVSWQIKKEFSGFIYLMMILIFRHHLSVAHSPLQCFCNESNQKINFIRNSYLFRARLKWFANLTFIFLVIEHWHAFGCLLILTKQMNWET